MAWLRKRREIWYLCTRVDGREIQQNVGRSEREAQDALHKAHVIIRDRTPGSTAQLKADAFERLANIVRKDAQTLDAAIDDFLAARAMETRPATLKWYKTYLDRFRAEFTRPDWRSLTVGQVNRWLASQPAAANAGRSLKALGHYCHLEGLWRDNCLMRLKPRPYAPRREVVPDAELAAIEEKLRGTILYGPFVAAAYAGLRSGEIAHLRLENIDRERATLTVAPYKAKGVDFVPKGRRARTVPMHPALAAAIPAGDRGFAFMRDDGQQWSSDRLYRAMRRAVGRKMHTYRHTFVSRLLRLGGSSSAARDAAGHSSLLVTDGYAHADDRDLREAIARL